MERISKDIKVCETIIRSSYAFFSQSVLPELLGRYYTTQEQRKKEQQKLQDAQQVLQNADDVINYVASGGGTIVYRM